jgi:SAM-dependent methyltransferase
MQQEAVREAIQEAEYDFPYHHLTQIRPFALSRHLFWGHAYAAYTEKVLDLLKDHKFNSLIDIGCGDGKLLTEVARFFSGKRLVGTDFSERALAFARLFAPSVEFRVDIPDEKFDAFTLIEVMEHIKPEEIPAFMDDLKTHLNPGAMGIITVPSDLRPVQLKHYQHFNEDTMRKTLEPHFEVVSVSYLNKQGWFIQSLLCNRFFILNWRWATYRLYRRYKRKYQNATRANGLRVLAVVKCR